MAKPLVAKTGTYEKNGETKGEYTRIGVILENDNGEYALIDPAVNLAGVLTKQNLMAHGKGKKPRSMVMCSIFTDEPQQQSAPQAPHMPNGNEFDDEVPF